MVCDYQKFKEKYLVSNYTDKNGKAKHTRFVKRHFYKFHKELKEEYGLDLRTCSCCGRGDIDERGIPFIMELDHINRVTNDSRISNLRSLCPICHMQTDGYKNRSVSIQQYHERLFN